MVNYADEEIQALVKYLPKRLLLGLCIHHRFSAPELEDLEMFDAEAFEKGRFVLSDEANNASWTALIRKITNEEGGLETELTSNPALHPVWEAVIRRDFGHLPGFEELIQSEDYQAATPIERYTRLTRIQDMMDLVTFRNANTIFFKALKGIPRNELASLRRTMWTLAASNELPLNTKFNLLDEHYQLYQHIISILANPMIVDDSKDTVLIMAASKGKTGIVRILLAHGANINARDQHGYTALMAAIVKGYTETVEVLLANGADIHATDTYFYPALMLAAQNGHTGVVKILLAHDVNVNERNPNMGTALVQAAKNGHTGVVGVLLAHGADINVKDKRQYTALMWATQFNHSKIVELIEAHQAKLGTSTATSAVFRASTAPGSNTTASHSNTSNASSSSNTTQKPPATGTPGPDPAQ